jgi:hypothetical protein
MTTNFEPKVTVEGLVGRNAPPADLIKKEKNNRKKHSEAGAETRNTTPMHATPATADRQQQHRVKQEELVAIHSDQKKEKRSKKEKKRKHAAAMLQSCPVDADVRTLAQSPIERIGEKMGGT